MPDLSRAQKLMSLTSQTEIDATYECLGDGEGLVVVPVDDFQEMGEPAEITVTIQPGDTLNPPEEEV